MVNPSINKEKYCSLSEALHCSLKPVYVYRNLRRNCLSLMQSGVVVGHAQAVILTDVEFRVRESGRQRVVRERQKNVHAFTIGKMSTIIDTGVPEYISEFASSGARPITYNPYKFGYFYDRITETPVDHGRRVLVTAVSGIYGED